MAQLTNETHLRRDEEPITDQFLTHLSSMKELRRLSLHGTQVSAADVGLPKELDNLKALDLRKTNDRGRC